MNTQEIRTKIIDIIAEEAMLEPGEVGELNSFNDVIDSLSFIVIVTNIEAAMGVSIPKDQLRKLTTLEITVDLITELLIEKRSLSAPV